MGTAEAAGVIDGMEKAAMTNLAVDVVRRGTHSPERLRQFASKASDAADRQSKVVRKKMIEAGGKAMSINHPAAQRMINLSRAAFSAGETADKRSGPSADAMKMLKEKLKR